MDSHFREGRLGEIQVAIQGKRRNPQQVGNSKSSLGTEGTHCPYGSIVVTPGREVGERIDEEPQKVRGIAGVEPQRGFIVAQRFLCPPTPRQYRSQARNSG